MFFFYVKSSVSFKILKYGKIILLIFPIYFLIISAAHSSVYRKIYTDSERTEDRIIQWVKNETTPNDRIYRDRIGKIGFYSMRYIVDPVGLINKDISKYRLAQNICDFIRMKNTTIMIAPKSLDYYSVQKAFPDKVTLLDSFQTMGKPLVRQYLSEKYYHGGQKTSFVKIYRIKW